MKVSVIIPVYNEEKYIDACLKSMFKQIEKADEVIIIDNNCTDRTIEIARNFPVKIVHEKKQGMTFSRNRGFNAARYSIIARTDADTKVPKDWVQRIKKHFLDDPTLIALSGPAEFYDVPEMLQTSHLSTQFLFKSFKQMCDHECLLGPNMVIRKSAWERVKDDLCEDDREVHEDVDLALHIAYYGKIEFDRHLIVSCSPRRWKKMKTYIEYPYRYFRMIQQHYHSIKAVKQSKSLARKMLPARTRRIIKDLAHSVIHS